MLRILGIRDLLECLSFFAIAQKTKQKKLVKFKSLPAEFNTPPASSDQFT